MPSCFEGKSKPAQKSNCFNSMNLPPSQPEYRLHYSRVPHTLPSHSQPQRSAPEEFVFDSAKARKTLPPPKLRTYLPYLHHTIPAQTAADGRVTTQPRVLSSSTAPTTTARYPCPVVSCPTRSCCLCPVESTIINSTNPQTFIHSRDYRRALLLSGLFASQFFFFCAFPASEKPLSCLSAVLSVCCIVFLFHKDLIHNKRFAKIYKLLRLNEPDISRLAVSCVFFLRVWFVFLSQNGTNFYNSIPWSSATSSFYLA